MNVKTISRLFSLLAGVAVVSMTSAHAAAPQAPAKPAPTKAAATASAVTVKLGDAMLEEYHNGDPDGRTTILRDGDVAQKVKATDSSKNHS